MPNFEFGDAADLDPPKMESPYDKLLARVRAEGEFYTFSDVSKLLDVSQPTIRKVTNDEDFAAPSKYVKWGKRYVWLFTRDDVVMTADALKVEPQWPLKSDA